ncbi:MAG: NapC/NirT family cytochrome c [Oligoflexia bacterium]|nr:NapC/NirT family cytochrome c [Oligoflexia bacterium]
MLYFIFTLVIIDIAITLFVLSRWKELEGRLQKVLTGMIVIVFTSIIGLACAWSNMEQMKSVKFCSGCHEMDFFVKSLSTADNDVLAAVHYQNNYVPQKKSCYACHTDYSMFGEINAKIGGMRHLLVHYLGSGNKKPKLYQPYNTNNCLYCHESSKRFRISKSHNKETSPLPDIISGKKSCLTNGCHDVAHYVPEEE